MKVVGFGRNRTPSPNGGDWTTPKFLFVGRDWERKNGPAVVKAFTRLRQERPASTLDVVGEHPPLDEPGVRGHGPLRMDLPEDCARLDNLYRSATCFVMPSKYEAFGIAYAEAGAAGIPSIGTTVGGSSDAVGRGGLLVDPGDDLALLDAMRQLSDADTAARLGALARNRSDLLTWAAVAERVMWALGIRSARLAEP